MLIDLWPLPSFIAFSLERKQKKKFQAPKKRAGPRPGLMDFAYRLNHFHNAPVKVAEFAARLSLCWTACLSLNKTLHFISWPFSVNPFKIVYTTTGAHLNLSNAFRRRLNSRLLNWSQSWWNSLSRVSGNRRERRKGSGKRWKWRRSASRTHQT